MKSRRADGRRAVSLQVTESASLLEFLRARLAHKSRNALTSLLARGSVTVDGAVVTRFDHPLAPGQRVAVGAAARDGDGRGPEVTVVFEDAHVVVIEKPAGLLSVASDSERQRTARALLGGGGRIFTVHRLDREVSGLMLYAKSRDIQKALQDSWQESVLERGYVAVVDGRMARDEGTVTSWLSQNRNFVVHSSSVPGDGRKAVTRYRVLRRGVDCTLVEVRLETGRKNQIRVHMQDLGHGILGDAKYGCSRNPLRRLALHARVLAFAHPVTRRLMRFETPIPREFLRLFERSG